MHNRLLKVLLLALLMLGGKEISRAAQYDVAAFLYPAYCADDPRLRPFWPMGIGEWETVMTMQQRHPGHPWNRVPLWGYINEADPAVMEMEIDQAADHGINSWNEWTETSYLQPDNVNGYGYLEAVKSVFADSLQAKDK